MLSILALAPEAWTAINLVIGGLFGAFGIAILQKIFGKKKEALEITNLSTEGLKAVAELKQNVNELVEQKTAELNKQIRELQDTIIEISIKYKKDLDQYIDKMSIIEARVDAQTIRTEKTEIRNVALEKNLEEEMELRKACILQLKHLQERVYELEKISSPISNQEKNNPNNKDNTLNDA